MEIAGSALLTSDAASYLLYTTGSICHESFRALKFLPHLDAAQLLFKDISLAASLRAAV
jgi:hypothetical protein